MRADIEPIKPVKPRRVVRSIFIALGWSIGILCLLWLCLLGAAAYYRTSLPDEYRLTAGTAEVPLPRYFQTNMEGESASVNLLGLMPIKEVNVKTVSQPMVIAGGMPFGIKLLTKGVLIIGLSQLENGSCPAGEAGLKPGDVVISMNGETVSSKSGVSGAVQASDGKPLLVKYYRKEELCEAILQPRYANTSGTWQAGMWVRDSTAGIGTVTFYDPATGHFGGLGHAVCDIDTGELIPMSQGEVARVTINGVNRGRAGEPGELLGGFIPSAPLGFLSQNTDCGIFGNLYGSPSVAAPIPIAAVEEVAEGSATILSTISGGQPKEYSVIIEKVDTLLKGSSSTRNMVIRVTDRELLENTGGIVQGMSGSPILQGGKLVGAVTHVFVRDPTKGYAIFAETMYQESLAA